MILASFFKKIVLSGMDDMNELLGGPQPFTRAQIVDPSQSFADDASRRAAIASSAETEIVNFVSNGSFVQELPNDLGDTAIWQGVYTAMCVMRWCARPGDDTQALMLQAATAMSKYFYTTPSLRTIAVRGAFPSSLQGDKSNGGSGLFHVDPGNAIQYFTDGAYTYREQASLDSLMGLMFGAAIINRFGDAPSKSVLAGPLTAFSKSFTAAGYNITNRDGSVTKYGNCAPGFTQAPVRILAATLPSLVAGLTDWQVLAKNYAPEFSTTDTQIPGKISYVNADLSILASLAYACAAPAGAPGLSSVVSGLKSLMGKYADSGNSFLIYACARLGIKPSLGQMAKAAKVLNEFPIGPKPQISLSTDNVDSLQPVPVWQRVQSDVIWQRSPYPFYGKEYYNQYNRMDFLIAHYLSLGR